MSRCRLTEASLAGLGVALILASARGRPGLVGPPLLPIFAIEPSSMVAAEQACAGLIAVVGAVLLLVLRRRIAAILGRGDHRRRAADPSRGSWMALGAGELILRASPAVPRTMPIRWSGSRDAGPTRGSVGFRAGRDRSWRWRRARRVSYSFDAAGHRVSAPGAAVDLERPTLLLHRRIHDCRIRPCLGETIPVRVGALLGTQSANLAVSDYSNDQSYLRLATELPRFREPLAVGDAVHARRCSIAISSTIARTWQRELVWQPAVQHWRLAALLRWLIPYRGSAAVEQGITRTRDSLRALVDLARARGAEPLLVVPQFGAESASDEMLRRRILDEAGLPYVHVELDPSWHLPGDLHPDPRAAQAIAIAGRGAAARTLTPCYEP